MSVSSSKPISMHSLNIFFHAQAILHTIPADCGSLFLPPHFLHVDGQYQKTEFLLNFNNIDYICCFLSIHLRGCNGHWVDFKCFPITGKKTVFLVVEILIIFILIISDLCPFLWQGKNSYDRSSLSQVFKPICPVRSFHICLRLLLPLIPQSYWCFDVHWFHTSDNFLSPNLPQASGALSRIKRR